MFAGYILQHTRHDAAEPKASPEEAAHAANFESCDAVPLTVANHQAMKAGFIRKTYMINIDKL